MHVSAAQNLLTCKNRKCNVTKTHGILIGFFLFLLAPSCLLVGSGHDVMMMCSFLKLYYLHVLESNDWKCKD